MLDTILRALPPGKRLVEPFVGAGAVFLNAPYSAFLLCDCNNDLINLFVNIQENGMAYIDFCKSYFTEENNTSEKYYALRQRFNESTDFAERAALLLYVNRHAFNGLVRYNSRGGYNVPFGKYKKPYFPEKELTHFLQKTQSADITFINQNYEQTFNNLQVGDVVYADPPYMPLSTTAKFTTYAGNVFEKNEHVKLAGKALEAWKKGIPVVLSNHDTLFTRTLYAQAEIQQFDVQRFISCHGGSRTKVPELLAIYT